MKEFINIEGLLVNQLTSKSIATTSIKFLDLISIAKFTARESQDYDPFNPEKSISQVFNEVNELYFQRLTNDDRVKDLYAFLLREINNHAITKNGIGSFPTAIILSIDINEEFENESDYLNFANDDDSDNTGSYYKITGNKILFKTPKQKTSLIVDGQHRLAGMMKLYNDALTNNIKIGRDSLSNKYPDLTNEQVKQSLENFDLNCTLLIGFDIWEQGKVFADVNFNQKPVNKSLYYDIFGSVPSQDKNDIFLAHMLAMFLNNNEDSVIKNFIKMLGSGEGYFSQAFFVEAILDHFKSKGIWADMPLNYLNDGEEYKILPKFFAAYFKAIKTNFKDYWPKPGETTSRSYKNILVKTTGMGALLKLINPIYRDLKIQKVDFKTISDEDLFQKLSKILEAIKPNAKKYFSGEGDFAGAGSLGLQRKLYIELGKDTGYFK